SIKIYYAAFGLARRFSVSSGEEMTTPANPAILRAGTDVLQKILRGKIFWLTPSRPLTNISTARRCDYIK
ncbi:MAG: hypothetical protein Q7K21_02750, partial [Elusimicrobiota bacterium]|nr:hypothetical protein [Elusimicrobiota bacterium]